MTSSVFLFGTEAWINILLVTISGRDRGCRSIPPLLFSLLSLDQDPLSLAEVMWRVCRKTAFFSLLFRQ